MTSKTVVRQINRYPVKGLSGSALSRVDLISGQGIPHDRRYAIARPETEFDQSNPVCLPKTAFIMLMRHARLAELRSEYDPDSTLLTLFHHDTLIAQGLLSSDTGRRHIESAVLPFADLDDGLSVRLVESPGHRFTDISVLSPEAMQAVSIVNLASVRDVEQRLGVAVDPARFRANLLIDGLAPWEEFDWVDRQFRMGDAIFEGHSRTRRCAATEVNPQTAQRDIRLPRELQRLCSHGDMGIYMSVVGSGSVVAGDNVQAL